MNINNIEADEMSIEGGFITSKSHELKNNIRKIFATNYRRIAEDKNLSQRDVCRLTGLEPYELNKYVTERLVPKPEKVKLIARALDVQADDLVPGYVTSSPHNRLGVRMAELDSGNIWLEFRAAFDPETASKILALITKAKTGDGPQ